MPYTKRKPKSTFKRRPRKYGRRSTYKPTYKANPRADMLIMKDIPSMGILKLKYSDRTSVASTSGVTGRYVLGLNCLYDCDLSALGHQPRGYDQIFNADGFFNKYVVYGCKVTAKALVATKSQQIGMFATQDSAVALDTPNNYREVIPDRFIKEKLVSIENPTATFKWMIWNNQVVGVKKSAYMAEHNYSAVYNNNPSSKVYLELFNYPIDGVTSCNTYWDFTLEYYIKAYSPNSLPQSS